MITAQFYKGIGLMRLFDDKGEKLLDVDGFDSRQRKQLGLPPLKQWRKTEWGYNLEFEFRTAPHEGAEGK
jgi:hypothetical protein